MPTARKRGTVGTEAGKKNLSSGNILYFPLLPRKHPFLRDSLLAPLTTQMWRRYLAAHDYLFETEATHHETTTRIRR
jgi:hypothetical protein